MKNINEVFDDVEFKRLEKIKSKTLDAKSWRAAILRWAEWYWKSKYKGGKRK